MTGRTNYVFCYGDTIERNGSSERKDGTRGMFQSRYQRTFKDAADGLSNTILMSEVGTDDGTVKVQGWIANDCPNPSQAGGLREVRKLVRNGLYLNASACEPWRGARWADGRPAFTAFNTVLPPNSASCIPFAKPNDWEWGIFSASSYHPGGVHVLWETQRSDSLPMRSTPAIWTLDRPATEIPKGLPRVPMVPGALWGLVMAESPSRRMCWSDGVWLRQFLWASWRSEISFRKRF